MEVINVSLYGGKGLFGGKEEPLVADIIYCDKHEDCSYYKNKTCFNVRALFNSGCKYGKVERVKGYTSRAKKYYKFKSKWENHNQYSKVNYPEDKLGIIGDVVVIPYPHLEITEDENNNLQIGKDNIVHEKNFISLNNFTNELIKRICEHRPLSLIGGEITTFQEKYVPLFLAHLKEVMPNKYAEFVKEYPEYNQSIDYKNRLAYLKTINPSYVYYESSRYPDLDEKWYWDGEFLNYCSGHISSVNVTKDYEVVTFKIKPSNKSKVTIMDNKQVNKDTIFID